MTTSFCGMSAHTVVTHMGPNMGIYHSTLWVTNLPQKVMQTCQTVCITDEKWKAKRDKGKCFLHYSEGTGNAHKVMYYSWKNHMWCVTWHCNIMKQICTYILCCWWHHLLMKLNCEMSKTHKYTHSTLQTSLVVMRENIVHRYLLISNWTERIYQRMHYTGRLYLVSAAHLHSIISYP